MRLLTFAAFAAGTAALAACATNPPRVYGPAPQTAGTATAPSVSLEGKIAECGHSGAAPARVAYPEGWQARLNEVAQQSMSNDELLGGPVTTEVVERDAQPLSPPVPTYPGTAATAGREGLCYALMDVSQSGTPEEILTACSSPEFNAPTFNAVSNVRFSTKTVNGRPVRRLNVVYPIQYCLQR